MKNADMPAMPMFSDNAEPCIVRDRETRVAVPAIGLTKREMMAMHILSALLSDCEFDVTRQMAAEIAVQQADALLAELEKSQ